MEIRRFCDITTLQGDRKSWTAAIKPVKVDVFFASPLVVTADKKIWHVTVMIKSSARHLNNFYSLATYLGTLLKNTRTHFMVGSGTGWWLVAGQPSDWR